MLRALGYPSLVSMESFRTPNFPLVAELLVWLAKRFDPDVDIPLDINTENERVRLIRNVAQFMVIITLLKINMGPVLAYFKGPSLVFYKMNVQYSTLKVEGID